jgi:hypothetical protein
VTKSKRLRVRGPVKCGGQESVWCHRGMFSGRWRVVGRPG